MTISGQTQTIIIKIRHNFRWKSAYSCMHQDYVLLQVFDFIHLFPCRFQTQKEWCVAVSIVPFRVINNINHIPTVVYHWLERYGITWSLSGPLVLTWFNWRKRTRNQLMIWLISFSERAFSRIPSNWIIRVLCGAGACIISTIMLQTTKKWIFVYHPLPYTMME